MNSACCNYFNKKIQIYAVIFDLDGTLLDTEKATGGVLKSFLEKYGKVLDDEKEANRLGMMFKEIAASIIDDYNLPLTVDEFCEEIMPYYRERWSQVKALPGANRLIRHLHKHGVPLALASNSVRRNIDEKISYQQGWKEMFSVSLGGDEVKSGKPSPDMFLEAAKRLGADASHCLVIEDSLVGVTAANAAGMKVVAVPSLLNLAERCLVANCVLQSLLEFQPEHWGLPPFEDWVHGALPIELLYIKGRIQEEVSHEGDAHHNLVPGNGSSVSLPTQISGVYIGWARKAGSAEMLKVIVAISWEHNSGIAERVIQPYFLGRSKEKFDGKEMELFITGYIRQLNSEGRIYGQLGLLESDEYEAHVAFDLPMFAPICDENSGPRCQKL